MSEHSPSRLPPNLPLSTVSEITSWLVGHTLESVERELILHTLTHCSGNRFWAASILGISPDVLEAKLRNYADQGFAVPEEIEEPAEEGEIEADDGGVGPAPDAASEQTGAEELPGQFQTGKKGARWVGVIAAAAVALGAIGFHMAGGAEAIAALFGGETEPRAAASKMETPASLRQAATTANSNPEVSANPASAQNAPKAVQVQARSEPAAAAVAASQDTVDAVQNGDTATITAAIAPESTIELPRSAPLPIARPSPEEPARPRTASRATPSPQAKDGEIDILRLLFPFSNGRAAGPGGFGAGPICCDRPDGN